MAHRNIWTDYARVREAIILFTDLLNDEFRGKYPEPNDWLVFVQELIDTLYLDDLVIIVGLMKYEIVASLDVWGLIDRLDIIEK